LLPKTEILRSNLFSPHAYRSIIASNLSHFLKADSLRNSFSQRLYGFLFDQILDTNPAPKSQGTRKQQSKHQYHSPKMPDAQPPTSWETKLFTQRKNDICILLQGAENKLYLGIFF